MRDQPKKPQGNHAVYLYEPEVDWMPRRYADKKQDSKDLRRPLSHSEMVERNSSCRDGGCGK